MSSRISTTRFPPSPFRIQHAKLLGLCRIEKASVSGYERHRLAELPAKSQRGSEVDRVEPAERLPLDQVAGQEKNFVPKIHLALILEEPAKP